MNWDQFDQPGPYRSFHIMGMWHVFLLIKNDEVVYAMVYGTSGPVELASLKVP